MPEPTPPPSLADYLRGLTAWLVWSILALPGAMLVSSTGVMDFHGAYGVFLLVVYAVWFVSNRRRKT